MPSDFAHVTRVSLVLSLYAIFSFGVLFVYLFNCATNWDPNAIRDTSTSQTPYLKCLGADTATCEVSKKTELRKFPEFWTQWISGVPRGPVWSHCTKISHLSCTWYRVVLRIGLDFWQSYFICSDKLACSRYVTLKLMLLINQYRTLSFLAGFHAPVVTSHHKQLIIQTETHYTLELILTWKKMSYVLATKLICDQFSCERHLFPNTYKMYQSATQLIIWLAASSILLFHLFVIDQQTQVAIQD